MTNYGFMTSNEVKLDTFGFPVGKYVVYADEEHDVASGIKINYMIKSGDNAGQTVQVYYNTLSENEITARIAQQDLKRIADATGKPVDENNMIQGRTFMVDVELNKKNPQYTNVKAYLPADGVPEDVKQAAKDVEDDEIPFG